MKNPTREELLTCCERGFVNHEKWQNRDSSGAIRQLGECYALLRSGCDFRIDKSMKGGTRTHWVRVSFPGFGHFENDNDFETALFYVPTAQRLDNSDNRDWY